MADPQAATDAPANAAPNIVGMVGNITDDDKKRDAILKQEATITSRQVGTEGVLAAQEEKRSNEYRSRMEQMLNAEGAGVNDLKPWNAQQELAQRKTGLWDQFGSPGFVIGGIASAFSGAPMVSALNAGAAAMNAINQGDMEGYNKAFEAWKDNTDLTLKRLDMEHKAFDEIDKLRSSDMEDWRARATLLLQRFNDQRKLVLLQNGMDDEYFKLRDAEATSASNMAIAQRGIMEQNVLLRTVNSDPRWKSGDPKQMMAAYTDAIKQLEQAKYSGRYGMFSASVQKGQELTDIKSDIVKEHPDWSSGQVDIEAEKRLSRASTRSAAGMALGAFIEENPEASPQEIQAFIQSGRAGRSGVSIYLNKYLQEHPGATSQQIKDAFQKFQTQVTAQNRFLSGPQGNIIRSLNVVVSHLQTMQEMTEALNNGDIVAFNKIAQDFAAATGSSAPTSFDTAKRIVGAEIIKALGVAGAGTEAERQEAGNAFERARSPEQIYGAIDVARKLLVGQLSGLKRQFVTSTGLEGSTFDGMLDPAARAFFDTGQNSGSKSMPVPDSFKNDKDGTRYKKDGKTWIKRGDQLIEQ